MGKLIAENEKLENWKRQHMNIRTHTSVEEKCKHFPGQFLRLRIASFSMKTFANSRNFHSNIFSTLSANAQLEFETFFTKSRGNFSRESFVYVSVDNGKHARLPRAL